MSKGALQATIVCTCVVCATALLFTGKDGWGWLLLLAFLVRL